jgi:hypothetical protein
MIREGIRDEAALAARLRLTERKPSLRRHHRAIEIRSKAILSAYGDTGRNSPFRRGLPDGRMRA